MISLEFYTVFVKPVMKTIEYVLRANDEDMIVAYGLSQVR